MKTVKVGDLVAMKDPAELFKKYPKEWGGWEKGSFIRDSGTDKPKHATFSKSGCGIGSGFESVGGASRLFRVISVSEPGYRVNIRPIDGGICWSGFRNVNQDRRSLRLIHRTPVPKWRKATSVEDVLSAKKVRVSPDIKPFDTSPGYYPDTMPAAGAVLLGEREVWKWTLPSGAAVCIKTGWRESWVWLVKDLEVSV